MLPLSPIIPNIVLSSTLCPTLTLTVPFLKCAYLLLIPLGCSSTKYKTLKEAKDQEARYRIKIANQVICTSNVTLNQVYQELLINKTKNLKKQSIIKVNNLYKYLLPIKDEKINSIDLSKYRQLTNYIESQNFSSDYNNKILGLFKQIVNYSAKHYNTSESILKFIEPYREKNIIKKEMLFFTLEEYKKFDSVVTGFSYHTFFELLYYNGLRKGEAQALTWNDIDFVRNEVKITKTITTKIKGENWTISSPKTKSSIRILPLTKKLISDFKMMLDNAKEFKDFTYDWFVFGNSIPFKESTIEHKKNEYCKLDNIKQIRIHDFRHSCASLLINQGASIILVSKFLGHSDVSMTLNRYTHMYKNELENVTNLLK